MGILSRFFGKPKQQSPLRAFLGALSFEQSATTYHSVSDSELRLPAALSVWALHLAHRYAQELEEMVEKLDSASYQSLVSGYDRVASEAAALVHYWLLRDFLNEGEIDDDDQPYFEVVKDAAQVSNSILTKEAPAVATGDWLLNRAMKYSHEEEFKSKPMGEQFIALVVVGIGAEGKASASLPTQLAVATHYPIFMSAHFEQFKKSARAMYIAHQQGAL